MKLTALRLHNVRRFAGRGVAIENIKEGVNVLCAVNEFGKSTCFDSLHALFFQPHTGTPGAVQALRPYSGGNPLIEADVVTANGRFRLAKQFYGGRRACVTDLASGRLVAQADEAERFIADLVHGGAGGPAGLLWVRQGVTGVERRSRGEEEGEKRARESVLSSVQGEVEALTGGRRMADVVTKCEEELARFVTATGRPKAGGPYALALDERDRLVEEARRFEGDVDNLHDALDERRKARARLAEIEKPEEEAARRRAVEAAQKAFEAAKAHGEALQLAEAEAQLVRTRYETARTTLENYRALCARGAQLREGHARALVARDAALDRQRRAIAEGETALNAIEAAEVEERETRELFLRLERAMRARDAAARLWNLKDGLEKAEDARREIEAAEAALRALALPDEALQALERSEMEIAALRAAETAQAPMLRIDYDAGVAGAIAIDGAPLSDGEERALAGVTTLRIAGVGALTVTAKRSVGEDKLSALEKKRRALLEKLGVETLAQARQSDAHAKAKKSELELARQRFLLLAPKGVEALRDEIARAESQEAEDLELKGDPIDARRAHEAAEQNLTQRRNDARAIRPARERADQALVEAEKALSAIASEVEGVEAQLGPEAERASRDAALAQEMAQAQAPLADAEAKLAALRADAPDLDNAQATLARTRSAMEAASKEAARLREQLADLNGRIRTRSDDAIEERWREAVEAHMAAEANVRRFGKEVALLTRLRDALNAARSEARDHYFEPVMRELRPLLGLLFEEATVVFDDQSLLPQSVRRNGQVEEIERLSGGMREQLAVLTRLAFARLLARDGRPAPVILDDALVYSDDDRIEKMFDALHRQSRDQQIIVFSCRQRAFAQLGGNILQMTDWTPPQT